MRRRIFLSRGNGTIVSEPGTPALAKSFLDYLCAGLFIAVSQCIDVQIDNGIRGFMVE
jgi:hypothetical protein